MEISCKRIANYHNQDSEIDSQDNRTMPSPQRSPRAALS